MEKWKSFFFHTKYPIAHVNFKLILYSLKTVTAAVHFEVNGSAHSHTGNVFMYKHPYLKSSW